MSPNAIISAVFPPLLPQGGTVGLVCPSCAAPWSQVLAMVGMLERWDYKVLVHDQCRLKEGTLAGSDRQRADAINDMFANPDVDAIMCVRGGGGAIYTLELLDYELIRRNPKPYIGFSDSTAILHALNAQAGLISFHGPMGWNCLPERYMAATEEALFASIAAGPVGPRHLDLAPAQVERTGSAKGRLVGGNICMLQSLMGTPYDWSGRDAILFIEETEEPLYRIERTLAHMRLAGKFEGLRAVLVGQMTDILDEKPDLDPSEHERYGLSLREVVLKQLPKNIPMAFNVPCGHGKHLLTFPVGAEVDVTLTENKCEMIFCP